MSPVDVPPPDVPLPDAPPPSAGDAHALPAAPEASPTAAQAAGADAPPLAAPAPHPPAGRLKALLGSAGAAFLQVGDALSDLAVNFWLGVRLVALRPCENAHWRVGGGQLVLLFLLQVLIGLGYDAYASGLRGAHVDLMALPAVSFWAVAALLTAALLAALGGASAAAWRVLGDPPTILVLAVAAFTLVCIESIAGSLLAAAADFVPLIDRYYPILSWLPLAWVATAYAVGAARITAPRAKARQAMVFVLAAACMVSPQWAVDPSARLWVSDTGEEASDATGDAAAQSEQTLYGQFDLLSDALDAIVPGQQGVTELFTISFAGDGHQDVFLNEAVGADAVLAEVFDSAEHGLVLANSLARPQERPFATVSALERALTEFASRMNLEEDVLALVLTSHGSPDHRLAVSLPPYQFEDLTPERLRSLLDEAGIRYRVIIVSACYSGGFVDALSGPDTMIITAAGASETSFGCRDGAQWTDFGRAYFAEALAQTASFEGAFRIARDRIAEREAAEHLSPSHPQMAAGAGIRAQLQRLETRSGGRILFAMQAARRLSQRISRSLAHGRHGMPPRVQAVPAHLGRVPTNTFESGKRG